MKVILLCGRICSGKSYCAERLKAERNAVLLSCDEAMACLYPEPLGDEHDETADRVKAYLYRKSLDILNTGTEVILDFGFWSRAERRRITRYYEYNGVTPEWWYIDASDELWERNVERRNRLVREGMSTDYYLDDGLLQKMMDSFEKPEREEVDVWFENVEEK